MTVNALRWPSMSLDLYNPEQKVSLMSLPPPELLPIMEQFRAGDMAGVLAEAEAALRNDPKLLPALALASLAALRLQKPEKAVPHLQTQLKLAPTDNAARGNLATALIQLGKNEEALEIVAGSDDAPLARIEGFLYQEAGNLEAAGAAYERAVGADDLDFQSWNNLGNIRANSGDVDNAVIAFERSINLSPDTIELYINLAQVLAKADRQKPRLVTMQAAFEKAPEDPRVLTEFALALGADDKIEEAINKLHSSVDIYAQQGDRELRDAHVELGVALESLNRIDELEVLVERCDSLGMKEAELAFLKAWLARRKGDFKAASVFAEAIPDTISPARTAKLRADVADRLGETQKAFEQYVQMNAAAIAESPPRQSVTSYRSNVEGENAFWSENQLSGLRSTPASDMPVEPVFLVGFPRSGTTLLDTMLMGNPNLHVMEERPILSAIAGKISPSALAKMTESDVAEIRRRYFELAKKLVPGGEGKRLVDKNPLQMARIPLIFKLFPNAQIILSERHPYDVVLSCFMANFSLNHAMQSFTSLSEAAHTYDAVFSSWENATRSLPVATKSVRYERLVANPATEMKPLIDWLGLEWHDAILDTTETARERGQIKTASYSQVTEPVYTRASGRWERYRDHLQEVMPVLAPWAEKMGYITG